MHCSRWLLSSFTLVALAAGAGNEKDPILIVQKTVTTTLTASSPEAISAALASISSLSAALLPPTSLASIISAIPSQIQEAFTNPTILSSIISGFATGLPDWYRTLPPAAQSYLLDIGPKALTIQPILLSLESVAGLTVPGTGNASANATVAGPSSTGGMWNSTTGSSLRSGASGSSSMPSSGLTSSSSSSSSSSPVSSSVSQTASSSVSAGGAPKQTAALAAGFLGAVGVLGLAVVL